MNYCNQNNYKGVPYPSGPNSTADIAQSGCGVCAIANVLLFCGIAADPKDLAQIFAKNGIRVPSGTDMRKASQWVTATYPNIVTDTTSSSEVLRSWLAAGGVAIANVDGDEGTKGVFSNAGHFINVIGLDGTDFVCFDVGYYKGKYDAPYRKPYVRLSSDKDGNVLQIVSAETLDRDTKNRTPSYYLFKKQESQKPMTTEEAREFVKGRAGLSDATVQYLVDDYIWGDSLIQKLAAAMHNKKSSIVGELTVEQAKAIIQEKAGLDQVSVNYLSYYRWSGDLVLKLAKEV